MESPVPPLHPGWQPPGLAELAAMLPQYEFLEILGVGGMGAVYRARQTALDRLVAIKVLPPGAQDEDVNYAQRFTIEARTMAKLSHPGIVGVHDFGEMANGQLYLVMEFVDGTDVHCLIQESGRLPAARALAIASEVCQALAYAHDHGVIHRDIKPANILIAKDGRAKVADFGLARLGEQHDSSVAGEHVILGTPDFVAPETLVIGTTVDGRADLFAVGVMLYNMLTGRVPGKPFVPAGAVLGGKLDSRLDAVIARATQPDPAKRYAKAQDMQADLDLVARTPAGTTAGLLAAEVPGPPGAKKGVSGLVLGSVIGGGILLAAGLYFLFLPSASSPAPDPDPAPAAPPVVASVPTPPAPEPAPEPDPVPTTAPEPNSAPERTRPKPLPTAPREDVTRETGTRYRFVPGQFDRAGAVAKAAELGGRLARVPTQEDLDWIWENLVEPTAREEQRLWVDGISDESGKWTWSDGSPAPGDLPWAPEQTEHVLEDGIAYLNLKRGEGSSRGLSGFTERDLDWKRASVGLIVEWPATSAPAPAKMPLADAPPMPPAPAPEPSAAPSEIEARLAQLEASFQGAFERDGGQAFALAVQTLDASYLAALGRVRAGAQAKGSLDEVTAVDAERTLIEQKQGLPPEDAPGLPQSLVVLRQTYRSTYARHEAERDRKTLPLFQRYTEALSAYETELTRANRIPDALAVRAKRDKVVAATPGPKPPVPTAPSPAPVPPPAMEPLPRTSTPWKQLAELAISLGGAVEVAKDGESRRVGDDEDLPDGRYEVTAVYLENEKAAAVTDREFSLISSARSLHTLYLSKARITSLEPLRGLDQLKNLYLHDCANLTDPALSLLGALPGLNEAYLAELPVSGAFLKDLAAAPSLSDLTLEECLITDEFLPALAASKSLAELQLLNLPNLSDAGLVRLGESASIGELTVQGRRLSLEGWDSFAKSGRLVQLAIHGARATPAGLAAVARLTTVERLVLDGVQAEANALRPFSAWTKLTDLTLEDTPEAAAALKAFAGCRDLRSLALSGASAPTDEAIAGLAAQFPKLEVLQLEDGPFTAVGLGQLAPLRALRTLYVETEAAADTWVPPLQKLDNLQELYLEDWAITPSGLSGLRDLKSLRRLGLRRCPNLGDDAVPVLKDFRRLSSLSLTGCPIRGEAARELREHLADTEVDF